MNRYARIFPWRITVLCPKDVVGFAFDADLNFACFTCLGTDTQRRMYLVAHPSWRHITLRQIGLIHCSANDVGWPAMRLCVNATALLFGAPIAHAVEFRKLSTNVWAKCGLW